MDAENAGPAAGLFGETCGRSMANSERLSAGMIMMMTRKKN